MEIPGHEWFRRDLDSPVASDRANAALATFRNWAADLIPDLKAMLADDAPFAHGKAPNLRLSEVRFSVLVALQGHYARKELAPDFGQVVVRKNMTADEAERRASAFLESISEAEQAALLERVDASIEARVRPRKHHEVVRAYRVLQLSGLVEYEEQEVDPELLVTPLQEAVRLSQLRQPAPPYLRIICDKQADRTLGYVFHTDGKCWLDLSEGHDASRALEHLQWALGCRKKAVPLVVVDQVGKPLFSPEDTFIFDGDIPLDSADSELVLQSLGALASRRVKSELVRGTKSDHGLGSHEPGEVTIAARLEALRVALLGLAVGDSLGERFLEPGGIARLAERVLPPSPWKVTDDTVMACAICTVLLEAGTVDQERLAELFGANYFSDRGRGYGRAAHDILAAHAEGLPWQETSSAPFGGTGSMGNGSAMRVAPLGAFFFDDPDRVVEEADRASAVTHWHSEGRAGGIATALAGAWATRRRVGLAPEHDRVDFVLARTPGSDVAVGIARAQELGASTHSEAVAALGNGSRVLCLDTVPYVLWCAANSMGSYDDAIWLTASGLGDIDTTCAIVGSIVAARLGVRSVPIPWRESIEPLGAAFGWDAIMASAPR